jgi:hypothetical protein
VVTPWCSSARRLAGANRAASIHDNADQLGASRGPVLVQLGRAKMNVQVDEAGHRRVSLQVENSRLGGHFDFMLVPESDDPAVADEDGRAAAGHELRADENGSLCQPQVAAL